MIQISLIGLKTFLILFSNKSLLKTANTIPDAFCFFLQRNQPKKHFPS